MGAATLLALALLGFVPQAAPVGGRVVDGLTGQAVPGAEVAVVGSAGVTRTDADGRFVWTSVPLTPAVIIVTLRDGRVARPVRLAAITAGTTIQIVVEPAVRDAITVTGVSGAIDAAPGSALIRIGADDLELRHPATMVQALEAVPGISTVGEGQGAVPAIRGLARGRTLILVDGARATSERRAGPNAAFVDPATIQSIEVARGPGSVAYGSDALGGVIALQLKGPNRAAGWRGRATGALGRGVPEQRGDLELSRGYGSGAVLLGIRAREFDDYSAPDGLVPNSSWRDRGVRAAWEQDMGQSRVSVRWQSDLGRDLGRPRSDSAVMGVTSPIDDSHRLTFAWYRHSLSALRNVRVETLFGSATQQTDQERLPAPGRTRNLEQSETSHRDLQVRMVGERAVGRARVQGGVDLQGRYGLRTQDTVHTFNQAGTQTSSTTTLSIDSANRTGAGVFIDATIPLASRLHASLGGRVDSVRTNNHGGYWGERSTSNTALAGTAALSLAPASGVLVTAQLARGFRDPTLSDRYYRGPVGRGVVEGNPDLTPETSLQFDLTVRITAGRVHAEISGYRYQVHDLVERYTVTPSLFRFRNRGDARFHGIEAAAALSLPRGFTLELAAQASRGRDGADDTPLDDVAPESASMTVRHVFGTRLTSYLRLAAYRAHEAAGPSEVPTPGYHIVDAGTSWRLTSRVALHGLVRNLFNAEYYASAGPRWVYAPGRQGVVTMGIGF